MSNISVTTQQSVIDVTTNSGITVTTPTGQIIDVQVPNSSVNVTTTTDDITVLTSGTLIVENSTPDRLISNGYELVLNPTGSVSFPSYTFPYADGSTDQILATDGAGNLTWVTPAPSNPFNQDLNTYDSVTFDNVAVDGNLRLNGDKIFNSTNDEFIRLVKDNNGTKFIEFGAPGNYDINLYTRGVVYGGDVAQTISLATLTTTDPDQVIDEYDRLGQRASNYVVQIKHGTEYEMWEGMLLHDDVNVFTNSYGGLRTGATSLANITADIQGDFVRLLASPTYANTTFRIFKTIFEE